MEPDAEALANDSVLRGCVDNRVPSNGPELSDK